jgi:hypothetical protein
MQSSSLRIIPAALFLPLACSGNVRSEAQAAGGSVQSGGSSASAGVLLAGGTTNSAGAANSNGGVSGSAESFGGTAGEADNDLTSVPEGLSNTLLDGEVVGGLTLIAFTLIQGAAGAELYTAVRNDGQTPSCEAGITTYFLDKSGQVVTTVGSVFETGRFYRVSGGAIIRCIDPGQIAMAGSTGLPAEIVIADLGSLQHAFPAFTVDDIVPIDALSVSNVQVVKTVAGSAYTGMLNSELGAAASDPSVTIFPLNRAGRPLDMIRTSTTSVLPAGSSWLFQTDTVQTVGVDFAAYASYNY